jgi:two-component system, OmpR family, phosphate regulon sensor histidine kinase PhoR
MSRQTIRVLVVLSILSIISIVATQIYWLQSAYALREVLTSPAFAAQFPEQYHAIFYQLDSWVLAPLLVILLISFFGYVLYRLLKQKYAMDQQRDFINNMTHEFQTPISILKLAADMLALPRLKEQPERMAKYVKMVQEESQRLQQQVETVLTLARTEQKTFNLRLETIDVHALITTIAERHENYVSLHLSADAAIIQADRLHLTNVLHNLLDNALKYSPTNPHIRFLTRNLDGQLIIMVEDNGIGIAPEHKANIFNEFYRVPSASQYSVKGFGLGLSYVRKIVKAHRWKLDLDSTLGKGSTFSIRISQPASNSSFARVLRKESIGNN